MTACALIIAASWPLLAFSNAASRAESGDRTLMYTFQGSSALVFIAIVDLPTGPQGLVTWRGPTQKTRPFPVSREQFNKMWSTLMASGGEKFAGGESSSSQKFDPVNYYVFSAAYMPKGTMKNFVVPNNKASPSLIALASDLRAYAK